MIDYQGLKEKGQSLGLTYVVPLDCATIQILPEVRDMCAADKCHQYNANWAAPPACGTIEECEKRVRQYSRGLLVQTVGELEDSMDYEAMMETERIHKENFVKFDEYLSRLYPGRLSLGCGCCTRCETCTYPDAPCRFPQKLTSSMEAYGMLVTQVCQSNQLPYYYGENTIAYTSCYLLE